VLLAPQNRVDRAGDGRPQIRPADEASGDEVSPPVMSVVDPSAVVATTGG
jgi:hypothetical protein